MKDIVDEMEVQSDELSSYLNKETGEIVGLVQEDLGSDVADEIEDDLPDWEVENIENARRVRESDEFIAFPTRFEINEYAIMERYTCSREDEKVQDLLLSAIRGSGAFGRFKEHIHILGVAEEWYRFRDEAFRDIAIEWCKENDIQFTE